jgi:putative ABC transport system permease protein
MMFRNYLKIALRNLWRNKAFTLINLGGLTISLATCLIIFAWVSDELNYDDSGANADRVFRVGLTLKSKDQPDKQFAETAPPLVPVLLKDFPEIEKAVRILPDNVLIKYRDEHFYCDHFFYADSSFFDVFGFPMVKGDPHDALSGTHSVVITESMARKYFGKEDPIGKIITIKDSILLTITGVAKDLQTNSHFHFDMIGSFAILGRSYGADQLNNWWNDDFYSYLLLRNASASFSLEKRLANIMDKYNAKENKELGFAGIHFLQPLKKIHLYSNLRDEMEPRGNIDSLRILIGIAVFLLVVATINYVNLTTATSFKRAKEIGIRKVAGAAFTQLVRQFLSESILIVVVAVCLSTGLAQLGLPIFNKIGGTEISLVEHFSTSFLFGIGAFALSLGLIAGIYPALYLSRVNPARVFRKGQWKTGSLLFFRKSLVVFQFSLSIILIIATLIALQQLQYMQTQDLGLDKEQVISIPLRTPSEANAKETLISEFEKNAGVMRATASSSTPGRGLANNTVLPEGVPEDHIQTMNTLVVDYDFIDTYKLGLASGRGFSRDYGGDSTGFILNEAAVRELGWGKPQNAIGKGFNWGPGKKGRVIGVVKDFHFNSLQHKMPSIVMQMQGNIYWFNYLSLRIQTKNLRQLIGDLKDTWKKILPDHPFEYFFVAEDYDKQYQAEKRLSNLSVLFSVLTILISCLGLLGLVMVAVSQRIKEIGVRKVLGASVTGIAALLSGDFMKLVGIAIIIASPIAWWLGNQWLENFAYHIKISWWVFILSALLAFLIALLMTSFQAIRAAVANPVNSLRSE